MSDGKSGKVVKRTPIKAAAKPQAKRQVLRIVAYQADGFPVTFDGQPYKPGDILRDASADTAADLIAAKLAVWIDPDGL